MASVLKPPELGRLSLPSSRTFTTSGPKEISGIGGGISVDESWVGAENSPQIGVGVGDTLGVALPTGSDGEGVPELEASGGSVIAGTGVAPLSALTVATTLVSSESFGNVF
jgi:hypothetical protein